MIKLYTGLKGFSISLFFIAALVLFISIFFWGVAKALQLLLPLLMVLSNALIIVFSIGILPATFFKSLRPKLCVYSMLMSHLLGALTWMISLFIVIHYVGFWGIFLAFLFQFLAPMAIVVVWMKGLWIVAGYLVLWVSFTYGMRYYSQWLANLNSPPKRASGDVIDVEATEV